MVRQSEINNYFETNIKKLNEITSAYLNRFKNKKIRKEVLINECYLHLIEKMEVMQQKDIERFAVQFIKTQIYWNKTLVKNQEYIPDSKDEENIKAIDDEIYYIEDEDDEFEKKLEAITIVYEKGDLIEKSVHKVFCEGKRTSRQMANHYGIPHVSANELINNLKNKIKNEFKAKSRV